jgi:hypothetical protein
MRKTPGFAKMYWYGNAGDANALVMDLLGFSLAYYLKECGAFSVDQTAFIMK